MIRGCVCRVILNNRVILNGWSNLLSSSEFKKLGISPITRSNVLTSIQLFARLSKHHRYSRMISTEAMRLFFDFGDIRLYWRMCPAKEL